MGKFGSFYEVAAQPKGFGFAVITDETPARVSYVLNVPGARWVLDNAARSASDAVDAWDVPPEKLPGLIRKVSRSLVEYCLTRGIQAARLPETGMWLFQPDAVRAWRRDEGQRVVNEHCGLPIRRRRHLTAIDGGKPPEGFDAPPL